MRTFADLRSDPMFKRILAALLCTAVVVGCCSCGKDKELSLTSGNNSGGNSAEESTVDNQTYAEATEVMNFTAPVIGDTVIIMKVKDYGEIKIRLFPEYAPKGVENFVELAKQGYYDGLIFHRVISAFMIQGGDPLGTGMGGTCIWGDKFDGGVDGRLIHAAGAVAYANSGSTATNGSQFYIVTGMELTDDMFDASYPEARKKAYVEHGGCPWLDGGYTIFGQVYDGLDVVFKIQRVETSQAEGSKDKPLTDVVMESVTVAEYNGEDLKWSISDYN